MSLFSFRTAAAAEIGGAAQYGFAQDQTGGTVGCV